MAHTNSLQENTGNKLKSNGQDGLDNARETAREIGDNAADKARSVGDRVGEFTENVKESLPESASQATEAVVDGIRTGGEYLRTHDFDEMSKDVTELVRSHPLISIGIGAGIGFALGRLIMSK